MLHDDPKSLVQSLEKGKSTTEVLVWFIFVNQESCVLPILFNSFITVLIIKPGIERGLTT